MGEPLHLDLPHAVSILEPQAYKQYCQSDCQPLTEIQRDLDTGNICPYCENNVLNVEQYLNFIIDNHDLRNITSSICIR